MLAVILAAIISFTPKLKTKVKLNERWRVLSLYRTLIFLLIYVCATVAYARESIEVNKRVFGYYSSMLVANESAPSP